MSLLPSGVCVTQGNNYFAAKDVVGPSSGVATGLLWNTVAGPSTATLYSAIPVPGLTSANVVQVTVNPTLVGTTNLNDAAGCWLIAATAGTNQILVYIAAGGGGTNGAPSDNAHYGLAWSVIA